MNSSPKVEPEQSEPYFHKLQIDSNVDINYSPLSFFLPRFFSGKVIDEFRSYFALQKQVFGGTSGWVEKVERIRRTVTVS